MQSRFWKLKAGLIVVSVLLLAVVSCGTTLPPSDPAPHIISGLGQPNRTMTAIQRQGVLDIVASSGIVEQVNGGQDWEAYQFWATEIDGVSLIEVYVRWDEPVESSGPMAIPGL